MQNHLQEYLKNIPQEESVNASVYNYELLVQDMEMHLKNGENQKVEEKLREYLKTFFEGEPEDQSEIYFLAAQATKNILREENGEKELFSIRDKRFRQYLRTLYQFSYSDYQGASAKRKGLVLLKDDVAAHRSKAKGKVKGKAEKKRKNLNPLHLFWQIVLMRENYAVEKMALKKVFLSNFLPFGEDKSCQHNINYLHWSVTRYPDLWEYQKILQNSLFFPQTDAQKKKCRFDQYQQKIETIDKVLHAQRPQKVFQDKVWAFVYPYGAVLRNRPDELSSRNVSLVQAWQPLLILSEHVGEDEKKWFRVQHQDDRLFLPADVSLLVLSHADFQPLSGEHRRISYSLGLGEKSAREGARDERNSYFQCYDFFSKKNYLHSVKCLLELKEEDEEYFTGPAGEFFLILLYKNLAEIGLRATAHENKYMNFVKKYPFYFVVDEKNYDLYPSDFLLRQLLAQNPHSPMLQYFEFLDQSSIAPQSDEGKGLLNKTPEEDKEK